MRRVFCDRLVDPTDVGLVSAELEGIVARCFPSDREAVLKQPLVFGDFDNAVRCVVEEADEPRLYQDAGDYAAARAVFEALLAPYAEGHKAMNLVLFEMAVEHLCRIHRILRMPRGHALLVGVGGSGKQSLTRLAAFCAQHEVFEITLARNYDEAAFREDLKALFGRLAKRSVVFLFTDAHVLQEGFLELVNNLLTTGMVPALFAGEERDAAIAGVRGEVRELGIVDTPDNCWAYFLEKCRNNLHVVLAMSPSGDTLRVRCRNFPGLVSATVIDWFFAWPQDALERVAEHFLFGSGAATPGEGGGGASSSSGTPALPEPLRPAIVQHMVKVHQDVVRYASEFQEELRRHYYVTPKNYLDFIENYRRQNRENDHRISAAIQRLQGGLTKLAEASAAVDRMSADLRERKVVVDAKKADCEVMIREIEQKTEVARASQQAAEAKQQELELSSVEIRVEKAKADEALKEALPALEAAADALNNLRKEDIAEVKVLAKPPDAVQNVVLCVYILKPTGKEVEAPSWKAAKGMMSDPKFLSYLVQFDKDGITKKQMASVKAILSKDPSLDVESMMSVSKAGAGLLAWVLAITKYFSVAKNVEPLRKKVQDMERQQAQSSRELAAIREQLQKLQGEIVELNARFSTANGELQELAEQAATMERRLRAASQLIAGLNSEQERWQSDRADLAQRQQRLVGDTLVAASFLSYLGAFTATYRKRMLFEDWLPDLAGRSVPLSEHLSLVSMLASETMVQGWVGQGLPPDEHSVQNGLLTTRASRFPLCIDPQQQAVRWIKAKEAANKLTVRTFLDGDFMKHLELAIQFGTPFLFEAVDEELDPIVNPVLEKNTFMQGQQRMIKLGEQPIEWDDNFRLYLTTKLANPHYSPEVMGKTMIINYSVTLQGLESQLLNVVVASERPDLEEQFARLVSEMSANRQLLVALEDTLLRELANSRGNILDNDDLIATLEQTKSKATEIAAKLDEAQFTSEEINKTRLGYAPVAKRGSILYFAMAGLSVINKMYEISLPSFLTVYRRSLTSARKSAALEARLRNLVDQCTQDAYDYTCTGIFERHKLLFSFQLTCMIMEGEGELKREELNLFLKGDTSLDSASAACPLPFLSAAAWKDLIRTSELPGFEGLLASLAEDQDAWRGLYDLETPETAPLPRDWGERLTPFQLLLVYRCLRPDRVYNAVKLFVLRRVGEKYVQPPVLDYQRILRQSDPRTPMVFILSPGADPQADIQALADSKGMNDGRFKFLALGQGQGPLAESMLASGMLRGHWVLLQNCHLLTSWLKNLERILEAMDNVHDNFRLWLTTDPTDLFPLGILQKSLKVVTEPPDGLKQNMRSLLSKIDQQLLDDCPHTAFPPLVYTLCFLHAVVLERRKYGKIGWNVGYDFNESDFVVSRKLMALYLQKAQDAADETIPWGSIKYLVGDAMYGGRVSDNFDRRILTTYMSEYFGDFLFDTNRHFYFSQSGHDYDLPPVARADLFMAHVEALPLVNSPAVFGLHPNAEIGYFTAAIKGMWSNLVDLQPRERAAGGGISREGYISRVAAGIRAKVPRPVDMDALHRAHSSSGAGTISPERVVLLQELERWNILASTMTASLLDLDRAMRGEIGMSESLDALGEALYNGRLPAMWRRLSPSTEKPLGAWMAHFERRLAQYNSWIAHGEPSVMWLAGLHVPESYLAALVQSACRRRNWPLDKSTLYTRVTKFITADDVSTKPIDGAYVSGLYLEGAAWDVETGVLTQQRPKVLVTELPVLQIIPVEVSKLKLHNTLRTPVYVTQARRNAMGEGLVFEADLATEEHASHWVLQGVCLTLNIDE